MKDGDKVLTCICSPGCGEKFDPAYRPDFVNGRVVFYLRQRNPAFLSDLCDTVWTEDSLERLLRDAESSVQYLRDHIAGWRGFDDEEWHEGPPPAVDRD